MVIVLEHDGKRLEVFFFQRRIYAGHVALYGIRVAAYARRHKAI